MLSERDGMLHNEARRLLVQAYEQTHDAQTAAKCFQISTSTWICLQIGSAI